MRVAGRGWWAMWLAVAGALCQGSPANAAAVPPPATISAALQQLAGAASLAFVGQVVAIHRAAGVVEIRFEVEQAVSGQPGAAYTLREWAGLWPPGQIRYVVGERALVFLHASQAGGLATPVEGSQGVLPVLVQGAGRTPLVDIRRLAAGVLRSVGEPLPGAANGALLLTEVLAVVQAAPAGSTLQGETTRPFGPVQRPVPGAGLGVSSSPHWRPVLVQANEAATVRRVGTCSPTAVCRMGATDAAR